MTSIPILDLIPQRHPFVMIDKLLVCTDNIGKTSFFIKESHLFVEKGLFLEAGLMENMAQTCAAHIGYLNKDKTIKIGVIGSIKNLEIKQLPKVNDTIETTIEVINVVFNTTVVCAKIYCNNQLIASCEMKVSVTDKEINA
ncbi:MAG: 3-hydroxyacyl-ACP dehydratase [Bacteroidales bacterium]|nr:3-hydroxyacyl-ACP dehydratase [Bacteroidales bacterium]